MKNMIFCLGSAALMAASALAPTPVTAGNCLANYISALGQCPPGPEGSNCAAAAGATYILCSQGDSDTAPPDCDATPQACNPE